MSAIEFLFTSLAGITLVLIGAASLGVLLYGPVLSVQLFRLKKKGMKKSNVDAMLVLGVIAFVSGILNQIAGMLEALEVMAQAPDISPQLVMSGIVESFRIPVLCAFVFLISLVFWYVNKRKWESLQP
ncbi:MAG: hypothetical protein R2751_04945 [Bacteroidales bacterium]